MSFAEGIVPSYHRRFDPNDVPPPPDPQPTAPPTTTPTTPARPASAVPGTREYTDQLVRDAQAAEEAAALLKQDLGNKTPEQDPVGYTQYTTQRGIADQAWAKAEQALAAELRGTYRADPRNAGAVDTAARAIAQRYADVPGMKERIDRAAGIVKTETPEERELDMQLMEVNEAAAKLDNLMERQRAGEPISESDLVAARRDYDTKQTRLVELTEREILYQRGRLSSFIWRNSLDPTADAAARVGRYDGDPEMARAIQTALAIRRVVEAEPLGNDGQMKRLAEVLPQGVDPILKQRVLADSRIAKIQQDYISAAAARIETEYREHGTVAAAKMLQDVTDPTKHPGVTPQIAAQIITKSQPTLDKVLDDMADGQFKWADGRVMGWNVQDSADLMKALSAAVEVAARGSDVDKKQYDTPEIKAAIDYLAHGLAVRPRSDLMMFGFRQAVGEGHATLALATLAELRHVDRGEVERHNGHGIDFDDETRQIAMQTGARAIREGLDDLLERGQEDYRQVNEDMAPLLAQGRYADQLTDEQFRNGMQGLVNSDPALKDKVIGAQRRLDQLGLEILRTSETVSFYEKDLNGLEGFNEVLSSRDRLMQDQTILNVVMLSNSANIRMQTQVARNLLADEFKNGGMQAQQYGISAQLIGDFSEFIVETYVVQRANVTAAGLSGESINVTRIGHLPVWGAAIWGGGGALQAALTKYLADNVHIDGPGGEVRKAILLGLVGGFAFFHLYQAAAVTAHLGARSVGTAVERSRDFYQSVLAWRDATFRGAELQGELTWGRYAGEGSALRAEWARHTLEATPGLIKSLIGLMGLATVWDASAVTANVLGVDATGRVPFKMVTQGANLFFDVTLLRLQIRALATKQLGEQFAGELERRTAAYVAEGLSRRAAARLAVAEVVELGGSELAARLAASWWLDAMGPIGWIVNIGYLLTTVANWAFDHNNNINNFERFDREFLKGAGLKPELAEVLDEHNWWTSDAKADGVLKVYDLLDGDPQRFLDWLNGMTAEQLEALMASVENVGGGIEELPARAANDYWMLPSNPEDPAQRRFNSNLVYDEQRQQWRDPTLNATYMRNGYWYIAPRLTDEQRQRGLNEPLSFYYNAHRHTVDYTTPYWLSTDEPQPAGRGGDVPPISKDGLIAWLELNGYELPPTV